MFPRTDVPSRRSVTAPPRKRSRSRGSSAPGGGPSGGRASKQTKGRGKGKGKGGGPARGGGDVADSSGPPPGDAPTFRGLTLNGFQAQALGPLEAGRSVLLAAPTGAGKTLVAEIAIEQSLKKGKRAVYTAPVKALSNQKYRDFKEIDPDMVGIMTGDVTLNSGAPLLVMTTEILRNAIFENPDQLADIDTVVFDEIHYMDNLERGTVWEESIIFAPPHIRFVCLSATIANLDQFGDWIGSVRDTEVEIIRHKERPVPLDHYVFMPASGLRRITGKVKFPESHLEAMRQRKRSNKKTDRNEVVDVLKRDGNLPALFFCFSRKECEQRAVETARKRRLLLPDDAEAIEQLFDQVVETFEIEPDGDLEQLRSLVRHGIAYHHAGMLPLHKELVERLFTSGKLQLLFATETFALGINMPARTVVFASLRKFDGVGFSGLKVREYQQMAGRAGRQGIDDKGLVISIVDDHRVQPQDIEKLLGNDVEPVLSRFNLAYSTLINLHRTLGDQLHEAWEKSFNNYQWSSMSRKRREKNEAKQRESIDRRMRLLSELGYITSDGVTEKGAMAAVINGYELQVVELVHSGLLEVLDEEQLAIIMASFTFEERKNDLFRRLPGKVLGENRKRAEQIVGALVEAEKRFHIPASIRPPNFKIGIVIHHWIRGRSFRDMEDLTTAPNGDLVRVMRLTVQLLRQIAHALPKGDPNVKLIHRARDVLNRDEVDAARQLSLG